MGKVVRGPEAWSMLKIGKNPAKSTRDLSGFFAISRRGLQLVDFGVMGELLRGDLATLWEGWDATSKTGKSF